jgi:hypothetical protein
MRKSDEREARHAALRAKHKLPDHATVRQIADAEIFYTKAWGSFVMSRHGGGPRGVEILNPETAECGDAREPASAAELEKYRAALRLQRDKLRKEFEASWPPADLVSRVMASATDGTRQVHAHNLGVAA